MSDNPPTCEHWILGNITVQEREGPHEYQRAVLLTFKTVEEYRAALRFLSPLMEDTK